MVDEIKESTLIEMKDLESSKNEKMINFSPVVTSTSFDGVSLYTIELMSPFSFSSFSSGSSITRNIVPTKIQTTIF